MPWLRYALLTLAAAVVSAAAVFLMTTGWHDAAPGRYVTGLVLAALTAAAIAGLFALATGRFRPWLPVGAAIVVAAAILVPGVVVPSDRVDDQYAGTGVQWRVGGVGTVQFVLVGTGAAAAGAVVAGDELRSLRDGHRIATVSPGSYVDWAVGDGAYYAVDNGSAVRIDARTGRRTWGSSGLDAGRVLSDDGDHIVVLSCASGTRCTVTGHRPDGSRLWSRATPDLFPRSGQLDRVLAVGSPATTNQGPRQLPTSPVVATGQVSDDESEFAVLDPASGRTVTTVTGGNARALSTPRGPGALVTSGPSGGRCRIEVVAFGTREPLVQRRVDCSAGLDLLPGATAIAAAAPTRTTVVDLPGGRVRYGPGASLGLDDPGTDDDARVTVGASGWAVAYGLTVRRGTLGVSGPGGQTTTTGHSGTVDAWAGYGSVVVSEAVSATTPFDDRQDADRADRLVRSYAAGAGPATGTIRLAHQAAVVPVGDGSALLRDGSDLILLGRALTG